MVPLLLLVLACGDKDTGDTGASADGGTDSGPTDGGATDGGTTDSGTTDSGGSDSGETDCPDPDTWYYDADGDGWGDVDLSTDACEQPRGYVEQVGDCDDIDPGVRPDATEVCGNSIDEDCDGTANACATTLAPSGGIASVAWVLTGEAAEDDAGWAVRTIPDTDGDGLRDVLVGAPASGFSNGRAWLVTGPFTADGLLADADATFTPLEASAYSKLGNDLDGADLDGDGIVDVVLGAPNADAGEVYIVPGPHSGTLAADDVGITISAGSGSLYFGGSLRTGMDLTGDGVVDLLAGTQGDDGDLYVIPGPITADGDADVLGHTLFRVADGRNDGWHIELADLDGDGVGDAVIAAPDDDGDTGQSGEIRVVLGPVTADVDLLDADSVLSETTTDNFFGWGLGVGDLDGDGKDDIAVGGPLADSGNGVAAVFLGPPGTGAIDTDDAELVVRGSSPLYVGLDVAIGDLDGDAAGDLVVSSGGDGTLRGDLSVFAAPTGGTLLIDDADRTWTGDTAGGFTGYAIDPGDLDGDGMDELVVGETREDSKLPLPGRAWIVKGPGW